MTYYSIYKNTIFPFYRPSTNFYSIRRFSCAIIGISLFYKELDFTKNQLLNLLQKAWEMTSTESAFPHFSESIKPPADTLFP